MKTRDLLAAASVVVTCFALLPAAEAHIFSTDRVDIVGFGNEGHVVVTDAGGCSALILSLIHI